MLDLLDVAALIEQRADSVRIRSLSSLPAPRYRSPTASTSWRRVSLVIVVVIGTPSPPGTGSSVDEARDQAGTSRANGSSRRSVRHDAGPAAPRRSRDPPPSNTSALAPALASDAPSATPGTDTRFKPLRRTHAPKFAH